MNAKTNSWKHVLASGALLLAVSLPVLAQDAATTATPAAPAPQAGQARGGGRQTTVSAVPIAVLDFLVTLKPEQKTKITAIHDKLKEDTKAATRGSAKAYRTAQPGQYGHQSSIDSGTGEDARRCPADADPDQPEPRHPLRRAGRGEADQRPDG